MDNQKAIEILRGKVSPCVTGEWKEAICMAISALEAQDAFDTNVGTSKYTVSATAVEEMLKDLLPERGMWEIEGDEAKNVICETVHDALEGLWKLPLAHPEQDCMLKQFGNCSYAETGCSDCAIKAKIRRALSSAQPETHYDEWCDDCKEYDKERHCCPRWNKVIRETLKDVQPEQRWIPCSERLPEDTSIVTVETKTFKQKYVCKAVWIPRWSKKAEYDNWEDCSEYNEDEDEYYVLEGWYERVHNWDEYSYIGIEDDVIAWMPLPKPYQEEGENDGSD